MSAIEKVNIEARRQRQNDCVESECPCVPQNKRKRLHSPASAHSAASLNQDVETECTLLPDLWAHIFLFLEYQDILQACLWSRQFLHDVMPKLELLSIMNTSEMHVVPTHRFPNVKEIEIDCVLRCAPGDCNHHVISEDAAVRVVPFLSKFQKLQVVTIVRTCRHGDLAGWSMYDPATCVTIPDQGKRVMENLLSSLCGAYRSGLFPQKLTFGGISCPSETQNFPFRFPHLEDSERNPSCHTCTSMCQNFPLYDVIHWNSMGWEEGLSFGEATIGNSHRVCLPCRERLSIIAQRPGGLDAILKEQVNLIKSNLSQVSRETEAPMEGGSTCDLHVFNDAVFSDLSALMQFPRTDKPCYLSMDDVTGSIMDGIKAHDKGSLLTVKEEASNNTTRDTREGGKPVFAWYSVQELIDIGLMPRKSDFELVKFNEEEDCWVKCAD